MYSVYGDGVCIYNDKWPAESFKGLSPKLSLSDNNAGSFEITLPKNNAGYDILERMKSEIVVKRDEEEIWGGRIIGERMDFHNNRILTCEGELAYLNDTTQPPTEFSPMTVREYMVVLINVHNSKVDASKRFTVGTVTVLDMVTKVTDNNTTMECLADLAAEFKGHIRVRKVNGVRMLDYLADWPNQNPQEIRFGVNLLDFVKSWDMTELTTVVMPKGVRLDDQEIEGLDAYLDVSSVNAGSRYVTNEDGIAQFGWLERVIEWDYIDDPAELKEKALEYLSKVQFDTLVVEVSAVDLRYLKVDAQAIGLLDQVRCVSAPHGMDRLFPVTKLEIQLDKPENSTYILGEEISQSLTASNKSANERIINEIKNIPRVNVGDILQQARDAATSLINQMSTGYVTIIRNGGYSESLVISSDRSYNPVTDRWSAQTKLWRWNINGLGFSSNGGNTYSTAIAMDGSIVANFITTGTMSAERVRTGILASQDGNTVWNLNSAATVYAGISRPAGSLSISRGSINLGNGAFSVDNWGYLTATYGEIGGFTITAYDISNESITIDGYGFQLYNSGTHLGSYGTQQWNNNTARKGMVITIESNCAYINWSAWNNREGLYWWKLGYVQQSLSGSGFSTGMINFGCETSFNNWDVYDFYVADGLNTGRVYIPASSSGLNGWYVARIVGGCLVRD